MDFSSVRTFMFREPYCDFSDWVDSRGFDVANSEASNGPDVGLLQALG